jgi:hypothetical protein
VASWAGDHLGVLATAAAILVFASVAVSDLYYAGSAHPRWGDPALIALSTDDIGLHPVLHGPYSRFGWHHPGPVLFYLLAIPYRVFASDPVGLSIGGILITGASSAAIAWICFRRGGRPLLFFALVVLVLFVYASGRVAMDYWNPWVTMLPFTLVVMLCWCLACDELWAFPAVVGVGSFVVQTHVGYVPTVLAVVVVATGFATFAIVRKRGTSTWPSERRRVARTAAVAGLVGAALWALPVIEQFVDEPGNVGLLFSYWRSSEPEHDLAPSLDIAADELGLLLGAATGNAQTPGVATGGWFNWTALGSGLALAAAATVAVRRRWWDLVTLAGLTTVAWLVAAYSVTRIVGPVSSYLVSWIATLGIPLWIAVGAVVLRVTADRPEGSWANNARLRTGVTVVTLLALAGLVVAAIDDTTGPPRNNRRTALVNSSLALADDAVANAECGPIRVRLGRGGKWLMWAVVLHLDRESVDFVAERSPVTEIHLEDWYLAEPADEGTVLVPGRERGEDQLDVRLDVFEYPCPDAA